MLHLHSEPGVHLFITRMEQSFPGKLAGLDPELEVPGFLVYGVGSLSSVSYRKSEAVNGNELPGITELESHRAPRPI